MTLVGFVKLFQKVKDYLKKLGVKAEEPKIIEEPTLLIKKLVLVPNPKYQGDKLWGKRPISFITKIIVHQELGEGNTVAVHNYHISDNSHLKKGGAPKIAYHYTIEKDGTVYNVNDLTDVVWHCGKQNIISIGIMLCGDFTGPSHIGKSEPTKAQTRSLKQLLEYLITELRLNKKAIYGHNDFGKDNCPGIVITNVIKEFKSA